MDIQKSSFYLFKPPQKKRESQGINVFSPLFSFQQKQLVHWNLATTYALLDLWQLCFTI